MRQSALYIFPVLYTIVCAHFPQKSTALPYSVRAVMRQASRHASGEPSCVRRAVMRQASRHASTVRVCFKRYSPIIPIFRAVSRQPSEYNLGLINLKNLYDYIIC